MWAEYKLTLGGTRFGITIDPHPMALVAAVVLFCMDKPYSAAIAMAFNGNVWVA